MTTTTFLEQHNDFPINSRIWIYQADRCLKEEEMAFATKHLNQFCAQWAAHGHALKASFGILYNTFIVLVVDENMEAASGCSIDSSVHFIKILGQELHIDFFNRNHVAYIENEDVHFIPLNAIHQLENQAVFNVSLSRLDKMQTEFLLPFKESRLSHLQIDSGFGLKL